jgi:hypothetical protein
MERFIATNKGSINLRFVKEFRRKVHDGVPCLELWDAQDVFLGRTFDVDIESITQPIVPASESDYVIDIFIDDDSGEIITRQRKVRAWRIDINCAVPILDSDETGWGTIAIPQDDHGSLYLYDGDSIGCLEDAKAYEVDRHKAAKERSRKAVLGSKGVGS